MSSSSQGTNILLFYKGTDTGKDFRYFIRNIYILTARELNVSITEYLKDYSSGVIGDPTPFGSKEGLLHIHDVFKDDIMEFTEEFSRVFFKNNHNNPVAITKHAIGLIVKGMLVDYKINKGIA